MHDIARESENRLRRIAKEPLLHFLLIALVLFFVFYQVNDEALEDRTAQEIRIGVEDIERLTGLWTERWRRPPTSSQLRGIVDDFIREEVLYREALALGLDEDDIIIRRRMAQKIAFLTQDLAAQMEPSEEELREWYLQNLVLYTEEPLITFTHIYFNEDERGSRAESDAQTLFDELAQAEVVPDRAPERGDKFMLRYDYHDVTPFEIRREFGIAFGDEVAQMDPGGWHGPIRSGYGVHLVRVNGRTEAIAPSFVEVRDRVEGDWLYEQNKVIDRAYYEGLLKKYDVLLDDEVQRILDPSENE